MRAFKVIPIFVAFKAALGQVAVATSERGRALLPLMPQEVQTSVAVIPGLLRGGG